VSHISGGWQVERRREHEAGLRRSGETPYIRELEMKLKLSIILSLIL
jgi:hypothetical protein